MLQIKYYVPEDGNSGTKKAGCFPWCLTFSEFLMCSALTFLQSMDSFRKEDICEEEHLVMCEEMLTRC